MKIKTLALIVLVTLSIGAVALISSEPIENEMKHSPSLEDFLKSFIKSMVVYAERIGGGPGSFF